MINTYLLIFTISLKSIITYLMKGEKEVVRNISLGKKKKKNRNVSLEFRIQAKAGNREGVGTDEIPREY